MALIIILVLFLTNIRTASAQSFGDFTFDETGIGHDPDTGTIYDCCITFPGDIVPIEGTTTPPDNPDGEDPVYCSPNTSGLVTTDTGAPVGGVWVWWKDNENHVRYAQTQSNGYYYFSSWRGIGDQVRTNQNNASIDTNFDGSNDATLANTTDVSSFGCEENPHTVTAIKAYNWSGSFSVVTTSFNNNADSAQFPTIIYTPGPNSASCIPNTSTAIEAPSSVTVGDTFRVTVRMRNNAEYTTWTPQNNYRLGTRGGEGWIFPDGNDDRVYLTSNVNGGDTYTFSNFNVRAPLTAGVKRLDVRMVQDGREWFGEICSKTITVNSPPSTNPTIQGINVVNNGGSGNASRTSGSKTNQSGRGYYNPITITLRATPGKNSDGVTDATSTYYVAFYDQSTGPITSNFINSATNKLANPANGVLLVYDQTNNRCGSSHCVFDPTKINPAEQWVNINRFGNIGYDVSTSDGVYYTVAAEGPLQWKVNFDRNFGTKSMYTSAYVFDSNSRSAFIGGDIVPQ